MPKLTPDNRRVLQYLLDECREKLKRWQSHETAEKRVLWTSRVLLLGALAGAVLAGMMVADAQGFFSIVMLGIVVYLQVTLFFFLFRASEERWSAYLNTGEALHLEVKNLASALDMDSCPPDHPGPNP